MADKEINDLTSGGAATTGDVVHAFRTPNSRGVTLGDAAGKDTGTTAGTVAAGDDSRITGASQKSANLSDLGNVLTARSNLKIVVLDETAYAALSPPDADTIYHIVTDA